MSSRPSYATNRWSSCPFAVGMCAKQCRCSVFERLSQHPQQIDSKPSCAAGLEKLSGSERPANEFDYAELVVPQEECRMEQDSIRSHIISFKIDFFNSIGQRRLSAPSFCDLKSLSQDPRFRPRRGWIATMAVRATLEESLSTRWAPTLSNVSNSKASS